MVLRSVLRYLPIVLRRIYIWKNSVECCIGLIKDSVLVVSLSKVVWVSVMQLRLVRRCLTSTPISLVVVMVTMVRLVECDRLKCRLLVLSMFGLLLGFLMKVILLVGWFR